MLQLLLSLSTHSLLVLLLRGRPIPDLLILLCQSSLTHPFQHVIYFRFQGQDLISVNLVPVSVLMALDAPRDPPITF
jgi:hypothetical protein